MTKGYFDITTYEKPFFVGSVSGGKIKKDNSSFTKIFNSAEKHTIHQKKEIVTKNENSNYYNKRYEKNNTKTKDEKTLLASSCEELKEKLKNYMEAVLDFLSYDLQITNPNNKIIEDNNPNILHYQTPQPCTNIPIADVKGLILDLKQISETLQTEGLIETPNEEIDLIEIERIIDKIDNNLNISQDIQTNNHYIKSKDEVNIQINDVKKIISDDSELKSGQIIFEDEQRQDKGLQQIEMTNNIAQKLNKSIRKNSGEAKHYIDKGGRNEEKLILSLIPKEQPNKEEDLLSKKDILPQFKKNTYKSKENGIDLEKIIQLNETIKLNYKYTDNIKQAKNNFIPSDNKENVINQVIEKAKILLTEDKSEMILQLKPENLGKLTLKVVTERGILLAKFVAENRQVKELIESNFAQLRESLQDQGLNIEGLSVSIQNDDIRQHEFEQSKQYKRGSKVQEEVETISNESYGLDRSILNPYEISQSSIDFTA